ncbi:unnamed protein product [Linum trigynum]|uniref:Uncharacterized protein n=1 Tax=Linum trigynum TaxID=586398 RepID=A0AAV2FNV7_9ROSI
MRRPDAGDEFDIDVVGLSPFPSADEQQRRRITSEFMGRSSGARFQFRELHPHFFKFLEKFLAVVAESQATSSNPPFDRLQFVEEESSISLSLSSSLKLFENPYL